MDNCKEIIMKLWQYGCSVSLGEEATKPYGVWIADHYGFEFVQCSESSASNPSIALKFCEQHKDILENDFVLFGWSHPSRMSWYNKHVGTWEHLNYIQQKKRGSALTSSVTDYVTNQLCDYIEQTNDWYPKHIVETTCKLNSISYLHIDCVPRMVDLLMPDRETYIADHLHPNDQGHKRIFELIKPELDSIINT
jgi:hypothetical protein